MSSPVEPKSISCTKLAVPKLVMACGRAFRNSVRHLVRSQQTQKSKRRTLLLKLSLQVVNEPLTQYRVIAFAKHKLEMF